MPFSPKEDQTIHYAAKTQFISQERRDYLLGDGAKYGHGESLNKLRAKGTNESNWPKEVVPEHG